MTPAEIEIDFIGTRYRPNREQPFTIGRDADLVIDENPFLHRKLLTVDFHAADWWLSNIGRAITAHLTSPDGTFQAWLGPGASVPISHPQLQVSFVAGSFTYDLTVFRNILVRPEPVAPTLPEESEATIGQVSLTPSQKALIVALAEPSLRDGAVSLSRLPSSTQAAERLGWSITTFNRKLDNVCDKLDRLGVSGLKGGVGKLASNRRARLVEYTLMARLVTPQDLELLDIIAEQQKGDPS